MKCEQARTFTENVPHRELSMQSHQVLTELEEKLSSVVESQRAAFGTIQRRMLQHQVDRSRLFRQIQTKQALEAPGSDVNMIATPRK